MRAMHSMLGLIMSEDFRESSEDECLYCGVSLLGLGPAWTLLIMGFFFFPTWVLGTLYAFSKSRSKRTAGVINLLMVLTATCIILVITNSGKGTFYLACIIGVVAIGLILVTLISYLKKRRQRLRANVWKRLRELMKEAREEEKKKAQMQAGAASRVVVEVGEEDNASETAPPSSSASLRTRGAPADTLV